jgi:hypothetical protein
MDLVPETLPYRVYLRGELGKLRHTGDATDFLAAVDDGLLDRCELPKDVAGLTSRFQDQSLVDAFVAELVPHLAAELADHCSRDWRRNSVADKLARGRAWRFESVPVREVLVVRAERALYGLFARHGYRLREIVQDPGLLTEPAYGDHAAGEDVAYPILLALRRRWPLPCLRWGPPGGSAGSERRDHPGPMRRRAALTATLTATAVTSGRTAGEPVDEARNWGLRGAPLNVPMDGTSTAF